MFLVSSFKLWSAKLFYDEQRYFIWSAKLFPLISKIISVIIILGQLNKVFLSYLEDFSNISIILTKIENQKDNFNNIGLINRTIVSWVMIIIFLNQLFSIRFERNWISWTKFPTWWCYEQFCKSVSNEIANLRLLFLKLLTKQQSKFSHFLALLHFEWGLCEICRNRVEDEINAT